MSYDEKLCRQFVQYRLNPVLSKAASANLMLEPLMLMESRFCGGLPFTCSFTIFRWVFMAMSTPAISPYVSELEVHI